jgi:hypothetical protein
MVLDSIQALITHSPSPNEFIQVLGFTDAGDGGGGDFIWDALSAQDADKGTIFKANGIETGRWKRLFSGPVNVKWFGAEMNGIADDSNALQDAVDSGYNVYVPEGTLAVSKPILLKHGSVVAGAGPEKTNVVKTTHNTFSTGTAIGIDAIFIIDIDNLTRVRNVTLKNMLLRGTPSGGKIAYGIYASQGYGHHYENVYIDNVITGFYWKVIFQTRIVSCIAQNVTTGFKIDPPESQLGGTSTVFERCWALVVSEKGYDFKSLIYSTMLSCASESILWDGVADPTTIAYGYYFDSCTGFSMQGCGVEKLNGCAVYVTNSTGFSITGMNAAIDNHGTWADPYAFGHLTILNSYVTITSSNFYLTELHRNTADYYISGSQVTLISSSIVGWGDKGRNTQIEGDSNVIDLTGKEQNKPAALGYAKGLARLTSGVITERRTITIANLAADSGIVYLPENAILKRVKVMVTNPSANTMKLYIKYPGSVDNFYYEEEKKFEVNNVVVYEPTVDKQTKPASTQWGIRLNAGGSFTGFACVMEVDYYISQF